MTGETCCSSIVLTTLSVKARVFFTKGLMINFLSKSQFIRGLQCHKSLWLYKNEPDLRTEPDEALQAVFESGHEVGVLARGLFPGGVEIPFDEGSFTEKARRTRELIDGGTETLYEAVFNADNILVIADILHKGDEEWELYEVKSSTSLKEVHANDVALQNYVIREAGLTLSRACLVHINNKYVRRGEVDVRSLFSVEELTDTAASRTKEVVTALFRMRQMLAGACPKIDIGPHCSDPYDCDFIPYCWAHIPTPSVFDLRGRGIDKFASYRAGKVRFDELDLRLLDGRQRMQVEAELFGREEINREGIKAFVDTLYYPLYYLDFETFYNDPIPPFDGTHPYGKIPFQYSIHSEEKEGGELKHDEFLAGAGEDGREELARRLTEIIPHNSCILTYNMAFEKGVIRDLAEQFPQLSAKLMIIHDNIKDLMLPFKERHYYTKAMQGSYSLKYVLPALLPDLSYEGLALKNGEAAVMAYKGLAKVEDEEERERVRRDLLEYCKLDTYAMVKLLEVLREAGI